VIGKGMTLPTAPSTNAEEIRRLVALAENDGHPDRYTGKRKKGRMKSKLWMEIRFEDSDQKPHQISTRDISVEGVGFCSRKKMEIRDVVYLRDCTDGRAHPWLKVRVTHCINGLRGYVVGGEFVDD